MLRARFIAPLVLSLAAGCAKKPSEPEPGTTTETASKADSADKAGTADKAVAATEAAKPAAPEAPKGVPAPEDVAAPSKDAKTTASGLATKVLAPGTGKEHPSASDKVKVHYTGWTTDGKMFDSSVQRGEPATFGVGQVIKGWTEGLQLMVVGEKRRFWIPAKLAYGETPRMGAPAGNLTFDVELLDIVAGPKPPADLKTPPKDAKKTASGLVYKVTKKGTGKVHPTATSKVTVHYSGWTTDGKLFDSSVQRGQPSSFGLDGVIKGWTEGVQLMVEGEKALFWIPGSLAYGDGPSAGGAPTGTLVFEIELLQIQ